MTAGKKFFCNVTGVTLVEMMIASVLISVIFLAGISIYASTLKMLSSSRTSGKNLPTVVYVEDVAKKIEAANDITRGTNTADRTAGDSDQINLRVNQDCSGVSVSTPSSAGVYWHYRFLSGALRYKCDSAAATNPGGGGNIAIDNLNVGGGGSLFSLINPSGSGDPTVVKIHIVTSGATPQTTETQVSAGSKAKR